jgi:hypothetical protein
MSCSSESPQLFEGYYWPWRWRRYVAPKRRSLFELRGVKTQKTLLYPTLDAASLRVCNVTFFTCFLVMVEQLTKRGCAEKSSDFATPWNWKQPTTCRAFAALTAVIARFLCKSHLISSSAWRQDFYEHELRVETVLNWGIFERKVNKYEDGEGTTA